MEELARFLQQRKDEQLLRRLSMLAGRAPARAITNVAEPALIDFSSNDYLGLSAHPALICAAQEALTLYGVGAGSSRLMSGDLAVHHELEAAVADFKGTEAALVFNSGYQANLGILPALTDRHDAIFADTLSHASLLDGAILSRAKLIRFRHNDMGHLADLLREHRAGFTRALLVTESVFSMDGDRAPLRELVALKERYNCRLLVDEAHATGVFGPRGRGCIEAEGLTGQVEFVMGTFSKALGGFGAFLASTQLVKDYLVNAARSFIYSTALPPAIIAADTAALYLLEDEPKLGEKLLLKAGRFRRALKREGWNTGGESQIVPVMVGESARALELSSRLAERGFRVLAVRPPTVPEGQARLRFSLCSAHNSTHLRQVLEALDELR
ncbi:MAG: 8-amino-7-oxononanoate synthase [Armatimonadota bacterium]